MCKYEISLQQLLVHKALLNCLMFLVVWLIFTNALKPVTVQKSDFRLIDAVLTNFKNKLGIRLPLKTTKSIGKQYYKLCSCFIFTRKFKKAMLAFFIYNVLQINSSLMFEQDNFTVFQVNTIQTGM